MGKVDRLLAFGRHGEGGDRQVDFFGGDSIEQALDVVGVLLELVFPIEISGDLLPQLDTNAAQFARSVLDHEWRRFHDADRDGIAVLAG